MSEIIRELKSEDFADLFGIDIDNLPADCRSLISECDFRYKLLDQQERDYLVLTILKLVEGSELPAAGRERKDDWQRRWLENLEAFIQSNYDIGRLIPDFLRRNRPIRFREHYGMPINPDFELNLYTVFRRWLFREYLNEAKAIYEFGCGTAFNLVELARLYPDKELHGLDWVRPPQEIIKLLAEIYGYNMTGHTFDMASPDINFPIKLGGAILTIDGLEQLGINFEPFLEFILSKYPSLCVQIEPLSELYDPDNLIDYMALKYSRKRNYLTGYLTRLKQLEKEGRIRIIRVHKMSCGLYHEGYSFVVWMPIPR